MDPLRQQTLSRERFPTISLHFAIESGKVLCWRLAADSELRVHHARVWLTRIDSPYDYWLQAGEVIRLQRRECIWLSTDADAAVEVSLTSTYFERSGFVARWFDRVALLIFSWFAPSTSREDA